ncbi:MAG: response regulator transcription factor [Clostridia bacterium]|jgi:two-component system response regulator ResD|uniref:response regulator transcription factor n=1 Tax=Pumilibacter muris TaxID=2941510 RepID=UPI00203A8C4F|nr:response regulator transcription factor [Pumilibacter muris]MCI8595740.1 response regulator transcription factor [Clostridia bacterium]
MSNGKILIVDDDDNICQLLTLYLVKEGYGTSVCHNGKDAIKLLKETKFDLVLLDVMMPQMDGYMTLTEVRKFSDVPIIMVSAKGEPMDKISGLDYGADDYVTKPFEPQELLSRIKALLRRTQAHTATEKEPENSDIQLDDLYISIKNYIVKVGGKPIDMPPKEIELLHCLASQPMQVFTREQLLQKVWSSDYQGDARTVDVHIKRIREKLGMGKSWRLNTVWGVGYKFEVL